MISPSDSVCVVRAQTRAHTFAICRWKKGSGPSVVHWLLHGR